jgi:hypothetical protein
MEKSLNQQHKTAKRGLSDVDKICRRSVAENLRVTANMKREPNPNKSNGIKQKC